MKEASLKSKCTLKETQRCGNIGNVENRVSEFHCFKIYESGFLD